MSEEDKEVLDTPNQDGEENSEKNLNAQPEEDNNGKNNEDDEKITLSKKDYLALKGQKEYYHTQYEKLKNDPAKKQDNKTDIQSDDSIIAIEIRQDYPQLTKDEALEIAQKANRIAKLEGKKISEALNDDYIKSSIDAKIKQKASEDASISSNRSPKGVKPSGVIFKPNMTEAERKTAYQNWLNKAGK